jgi:hypothetical protein
MIAGDFDEPVNRLQDGDFASDHVFPCRGLQGLAATILR